jgi:hypothetical protein
MVPPIDEVNETVSGAAPDVGEAENVELPPSPRHTKESKLHVAPACQ